MAYSERGDLEKQRGGRPRISYSRRNTALFGKIVYQFGVGHLDRQLEVRVNNDLSWELRLLR